MYKDECREILELYCSHARMPQELKQGYLDVLEQKWDKISESIQGNNVYKYVFLPASVQFWLIVGKTDEYLLLKPSYCSCHDFYFSAISKRKAICCYHIITQLISERSNRFTTIFKDDSMYLEYLADLLKRT